MLSGLGLHTYKHSKPSVPRVLKCIKCPRSCIGLHTHPTHNTHNTLVLACIRTPPTSHTDQGKAVHAILATQGQTHAVIARPMSAVWCLKSQQKQSQIPNSPNFPCFAQIISTASQPLLRHMPPCTIAAFA